MTSETPKPRFRKAFTVPLLVAVLGAAGVLLWGYAHVTTPGPLAETTTMVVKRGSSLRDIADQLAAKGVIEHPLMFVIASRLMGTQSDLKAGEYAFDKGVSVERAIAILREGKTVARRLTIAEGLTAKEVVALLKAADGLDGAIDSTPPEGSLLPDTYHFSHGDTRKDVVARMTRAMDDALAELWAKRAANLPLATPQEALIIASIVEKETGVASERPRVAAVFLNRLRKGMRIESDPTVVYGLNDGAGPLGRPLTRADLKRDHPYNTYRIKRLPPGPIANPGRESLAAVMNPIVTDELYFVADGTGGHVFAKTLKEHNRNVARWRKLKRQRKREAESKK